jgi:hypothetical protein
VLESGTNVKVLQSLLGHENLNTTEVYLSLTDRELYAAAKRLEEREGKTSEEVWQQKTSPEVRGVSTVPLAPGRSNDPWTESLRVALDPNNLGQALKPEKVEDMSLTHLPVIDKTTSDYILKLVQNDARRCKR